MNSLPHGSNPATAGFTCNTCSIRFLTAELQRQHMKTDWHRYNLKRKVANLPGISSEMFAEKVLTSQSAQDRESASEDEFGFHLHHRRRSGKGARQMTKKELRLMSKLPSRGRKLNEVLDSTRTESPAPSEISQFSLGDSTDLSEADSYSESNSEINSSELSDWSHLDESEEDYMTSDQDDELSDYETIDTLSNHCCFYCGKNNHEVEQNIKHMTNHHGFYIPERSFLVDLDGLLTFINEVIIADNECFVCGFEGKSLESIRQHLASKGHCRIPYETQEEKDVIAEFYNFDIEPSSKSRRTKTKSVSFVSAQRERKSEPVRCSSEGEVLQKDSGNLVSEVVLPNGSKIGHRALVRVSRPSTQAVKELDECKRTVALVDRRYSPGITDHQISKQERETQRIEVKSRNLYLRKSKPARVNYQPHFRDEILGKM